MAAIEPKTHDLSHLSPVWGRAVPASLIASHGEGPWLYTVDGRKLLDFTCGIGVTNTGHAHPRVVAAVQAQAAKILHAQVNVVYSEPLIALSHELAALLPAHLDSYFFSNSGAEITEAAVKLAKQASKRPNVIVFSGSFHGRTHLAMSMTTSKTIYRAGYQPMVPGIYVAPYPYAYRYGWDEDATTDYCLRELKHLLKAQTAPDETAAVIIEPVLGEGGYVPAPARFLEGVVDLCREHGILFIADEVQSGFGRTGKLFAVEHYGIEPDIVCMAKGIASGFPFAALGTRRELSDRWPTGSHGGTYGGNAIGCAAALATIEVLTAPGFLDAVTARGDQLMAGVRELQRHHDGIAQVRGLGLMVGTEFADAARVAAVQKHCLEEGRLILMNAGTYGRTLRWMPPLVVTEQEVDLALAAFGAALKVTA